MIAWCHVEVKMTTIWYHGAQVMRCRTRKVLLLNCAEKIKLKIWQFLLQRELTLAASTTQSPLLLSTRRFYCLCDCYLIVKLKNWSNGFRCPSLLLILSGFLSEIFRKQIVSMQYFVFSSFLTSVLCFLSLCSVLCDDIVFDLVSKFL